MSSSKKAIKTSQTEQEESESNPSKWLREGGQVIHLKKYIYFLIQFYNTSLRFLGFFLTTTIRQW